MENSMEVPQKLKIELSYVIVKKYSNFTSRYLPEERKNTNSKRYMHTNVYCSIMYNRQVMEATQVSIDRCIYKEDLVYKCNEILLSHKKEKYYHLQQQGWTLRVLQ